METFAATFLVVFRETLEAALIVGIILTLLAKVHSNHYRFHVLGSVALAVAASLGVAWGFERLTGTVEGALEKALEGGISLAACGVLTYMVFWMDQQGHRIRPEIETQMEEAVTRGEYVTIVSLPFLAVLREGAETVLFLKAVALQHSQAVSWWGGSLGIAVALAVTSLVFLAGKKIPLRTFFRGTGFLLLLIAAGLLAYGLHEFQELNLLPLRQTAWDTNPILNEKEGLGAFLKSLFGYNGNPSYLEVLAYGTYLAAVAAFLRLKKA